MSTELFLAAPFDRLWRGQDPFSAVEHLQGVEYRALEGRRTFRTEVEGRGYFVKIHRGVGWREIFKNLASLRLPVLGASNEYFAIRHLALAHVPSMHPVAFGTRGANPATRHSFLITEELAPTLSLDVAWPGCDAARRQGLAREVGRMTRAMHAAGINHRDLYLCHFLLHTDVDRPSLSLIDLHRAQIRPQVPRRWRDKDLAALYFSALETGVSRHDLLRFLRVYFDTRLRHILARESALLGFLNREGMRLQARYQRKFAPASQRGAQP